MILVIKLSGKVLAEGRQREHLCRQIAQLCRDSHQLALVHGAGEQLNNMSERLGIPIVQHQGRRVTDKATLELATMVFSSVNRSVTAGLQAAGIPSIGIAAFDAGLTTCRRRPPFPVPVTNSDGDEEVKAVDFGLVAEIESVDPSVIQDFWKSGWVPIVSCLGADNKGQILNVNADTLAAELAISVGAARLLSVSDVEGIYQDVADPESRIPTVTSSKVRALMSKGVLTNGMVPKVQTAIQALEQGVPSVQIVSGIGENTLLEALEGKAGTLLTEG